MPTDAADTYASVHKQGTATFLARVVDADGSPVTPPDLAAIEYSVYLLTPDDPDARTAVAGHSAVAVPVEAAVCGSLQTGPIWTRDVVGYNFRHTLDIAAQPAFAIAGRLYLVEYRFRPRVGQVILLRFRMNVI